MSLNTAGSVVPRLRTLSRRLESSLAEGSKPTSAMEEFDADPYLLGVANGVVDLHTGEFRKARPGDLLRRTCNVEWQGIDTACPVWDAFVQEIVGEDADVAAFLQRVFGYALTGLSCEPLFVVLAGEGRNGKTVMVETLGKVCGDYMNDQPTKENIEAFRKVRDEVDKATAPGGDGRLFAKKKDALAYLQGRGFAIQKTKFYADCKAGLVPTDTGGRFEEAVLLAYAAALPTVVKEEDGKLSADALRRISADADHKAEQAMNALACVDDSWTPSLRYMLEHQEEDGQGAEDEIPRESETTSVLARAASRASAILASR